MQQARRHTKVLAVTTSTLEGWTITDYIGIVSSHVVAGTGLFSDIFASFSDVFGGRSQAYQRQLSAIDSEAITLLQAEALRLGGNVLLGLRVDHDEISGKSKSMLMCTAQATVAVARKNEETQASSRNEVRQVDADAIIQLSERKQLLSKFESGAAPTPEEWKYITEHHAQEFVPWVVAFLGDVKADFSQPNTFQDAVSFLSVVPEEDVRIALCRSVPKAENYKRLVEVVERLRLMDIAIAREFITSPATTVAKRGLALVECHKRAYSAHDAVALEELLPIIPKCFPRLAPVIEERGIFGKKECWRCPKCKKANDPEAEKCLDCLTDAWGFESGERRVSEVLERLKNRVALLRELLEENSQQ